MDTVKTYEHGTQSADGRRMTLTGRLVSKLNLGQQAAMAISSRDRMSAGIPRGMYDNSLCVLTMYDHKCCRPDQNPHTPIITHIEKQSTICNATQFHLQKYPYNP